MKISVILPCYNAERYLNACFESLFAQSMRDFEVIFIDDGSLDGSLAIARRCAGRDDRIRVFAQENQGVSAARNLGLSHARGEWITFVDGDDILPPDALETLLSGAAEDVDMVVCPHETFDEAGACAARLAGNTLVSPKRRTEKKRGGTPTDRGRLCAQHHVRQADSAGAD